MIFRDVDDNVIRIPDNKLCGIAREDGSCFLWCTGDAIEYTNPYKVTCDTFDNVMNALEEGK